MTCPLPPGSRVVAYLRDSGHADQERSIGQQRAVVERYCQQHHLILAATYTDEARPGASIAGRDAFQAMIADLRRLAPEPERGQRNPAAPDGLLYWDLKRFARDQDDGAFYRADLRRRGYALVSLSDEIPAGDVAPVIEALLSWKSEQDRRDLGKDIKRGLHELVTARDDRGNYLNLAPGRVPVGFRREDHQWGTRRDGRPRIVGRWVPDRGGTWELVQRAFELRAAGVSLADIMHKTRILRTITAYSRLFRNQLYLGHLTYGGHTYRHWIEPCVDQQTWDRVQVLNREQPPPRRGTSTYTLSGWLKCGIDGAAMAGSTTTVHRGERTYTYRWYICTRRRIRLDCSAPYIHADRIEAAVYDVLARQILTPERLYQLLEDHQPGDQRHRDLEMDIARLSAEQTRVETAIDRLVSGVERGGHIAALVDRLHQRTAELARINADLALTRRQIDALNPDPISRETLADFCHNARAVLATGDVPAVRSVLRQILVSITAHPDHTGVICHLLPTEVQSPQRIEHETPFSW